MIFSIYKKTRELVVFAVGIMAVHCSLFSLTGCSDAWENHYEPSMAKGTESLMTVIDADPQLSNFGKLLRSTHLYTHDRRTSITYADLLSSDQSLTVWAPVDGSYNADSLLALCQTAKGDSGVATHFVCNHIARSLHGINDETYGRVRMLNDKYVPITSYSTGGSDVLSTNIPAKNGLLHKLSSEAYYYYNIYDAITSLDEFAHFGSSLLAFERRELDEDASIVADIINGEKIYSDSVTHKTNSLFRKLGYLNSEDSSFFMLAPTEKVWKSAYENAKKYFNYGSVEKADSIQSYWTNVSLLQDLFYNNYYQISPKDSLMSNAFTYYNWPYNVYYKPFDEDGIITCSKLSGMRLCSNGEIYYMTEWPFTAKQLFFHPITMQAEDTWLMTKNTDCTWEVYEAFGDTISGNKYLDIKAKSNKNWSMSFNVGGTLSGTYDVCAVILPKTVYRANSRDFRPNKLTASVSFTDEKGETQTIDLDEGAYSTGYTVDTINIGRVTLPVCNYGQKDPNVNVTLKCILTRTETSKINREVLLDCIYLRPVSEEDIINEEESKQNGAKARKEAKK